MVVEIESEAAARQILSRALLVRCIIALAGSPQASLEALHSDMQAHHTDFWQPHLDTTFRFDLDAFGRKLSAAEQVALCEGFAYGALRGRISLHRPDVIFSVRIDALTGLHYFGRWVGESNRDVIDRFDLKKRAYIGITSFEAELSLVMSNLALVRRGDLVLDPFVGTGSFLYTAAAFGAYTLGSDIDGRQLRGSAAGSFEDNLRQYDVGRLVLGGLIQDVNHHGFRDGIRFDAIITDPPYGIRAGAKTIGGFDTSRPNGLPQCPLVRAERYPKTVPYEMDRLVRDLYGFAARTLRPSGRLLFWFPVDRDTAFDRAADMPADPRFTAVASCRQRCAEFDRYLVIAQLK